MYSKTYKYLGNKVNGETISLIYLIVYISRTYRKTVLLS